MSSWHTDILFDLCHVQLMKSQQIYLGANLQANLIGLYSVGKNSVDCNLDILSYCKIPWFHNALIMLEMFHVWIYLAVKLLSSINLFAIPPFIQAKVPPQKQYN